MSHLMHGWLVLMVMGVQGGCSGEGASDKLGTPGESDTPAEQTSRLTADGVERVVPLRFVHVRATNDSKFYCRNDENASTDDSACTESRIVPDTYGAIDELNATYRGAGIQFVLQSIESVYAPKLQNHYTLSTYKWSDIKSEFFATIPTVPTDGGVPSTSMFNPREWWTIEITKYGDPNRIDIIVPDTYESGDTDFPTFSRYMRVSGGFMTPNRDGLAHEMGHWWDLRHPFQDQTFCTDPITLGSSSAADFWDLYYCPGTSPSSPHKFFKSREEALPPFSCAGGLQLIGREGACSVPDSSTSLLNCNVGKDDNPLTYREPYNSNNWQIQALGAPSNGGGSMYATNAMDYQPAFKKNRISSSQIRHVRQISHYQMTSTISNIPILGVRTGRTDVGNRIYRQPTLKLDFDGDGFRDIGFWQPPVTSGGTGKFTIFFSSYSSGSTHFSATNKLELSVSGMAIGAIPVPMDYDADGRTDIGWYTTSTTSGTASAAATWNWCLTAHAPSSASSTTCTIPSYKNFGQRQDLPLPGLDWDGDGKEDMTILRSDGSHWGWINGPSPFSGAGTARSFSGVNGAVPMPGLYDTDNKTDIVWYDPATATFGLSPSGSNWPTSGYATVSYASSGCVASSTGTASDRISCVPLQGMYSGTSASMRLGVGIYNPNNGNFEASWRPLQTYPYPYTGSCNIPVTATQNGMIQPLGLIGADFASTTGGFASFSEFIWGQGISSSYSDGFIKSRAGALYASCGATTNTINVGLTPASWATFAIMDATGDKEPPHINLMAPCSLAG